MALYIYNELPDSRAIRILSLSPSDEPDNQLNGAFITIIVDGAPAFEAISYVWGQNPTFSQSIWMEDAGSVFITPNLAAALKRFRRKKEHRLLWVDGICIDQGNDKEKAVQVPLMASIYQKATKTLAWLGGDLKIPSYYLQQREGSSEAADRPPTSTKRADNEQIRTDDTSGVEVVLRNPWFTRLWIAQEAILSQELELHCGECIIPWKALADLVEQFQKLKIYLSNAESRAGLHIVQHLITARFDWQRQDGSRQILRDPLPDLFQSSRIDTLGKAIADAIHVHWKAQLSEGSNECITVRFDEDRGNTFMEIFWSLQSRHCADDRDRVYAALGFLPWDVPLKIEPDYSKSVRAVYVELTLAMLKLHYSDILLYAGLWDRVPDDANVISEAETTAEEESHSIPSWVPELRHSKLKTGVMNAWDHPMLREPMRALEDPRIQLDDGLSSGRICIEAAIFDNITGGRLSTGSLDSVEAVINALRLYFLGFTELNGEDTKIEDFGKLLGIVPHPERGTAGRKHPERDLERLEHFLYGDEKENLALLAAREDVCQLFPEAEEQIEAYFDLSNFLGRRLSNRMFFTTEKGKCGLAPAMARPGDALVRFIGLQVDFLIRKVDMDGKESGDYRLIGPCYLHSGQGCPINYQAIALV
jgi:hypothetical protein